MGWDVIDEFEKEFIYFFETKLSIEERTFYEKIFHNILMDFKTIFQVEKDITSSFNKNKDDIVLL